MEKSVQPTRETAYPVPEDEWVIFSCSIAKLAQVASVTALPPALLFLMTDASPAPRNETDVPFVSVIADEMR